MLDLDGEFRKLAWLALNTVAGCCVEFIFSSFTSQAVANIMRNIDATIKIRIGSSPLFQKVG
jgi:hypothetical protein